MNYLAHTALSHGSPKTRQEITIGNLIADHVRGPDLSSFPVNIAKGIQLHREIDGFFDNHPEVTRLRALMPQGLRRYSGIAIDFWFDHLLAQRWETIYSTHLEDFQHQVNELINDYWRWIPSSQHRFMEYLIHENLFLKYQSSHHIRNNLKLVSNRLRQGDKLMECMSQLSQYRAKIEHSFDKVYPDVDQHCQQWISSNA